MGADDVMGTLDREALQRALHDDGKQHAPLLSKMHVLDCTVCAMWIALWRTGNYRRKAVTPFSSICPQDCKVAFGFSPTRALASSAIVTEILKVLCGERRASKVSPQP